VAFIWNRNNFISKRLPIVCKYKLSSTRLHCILWCGLWKSTEKTSSFNIINTASSVNIYYTFCIVQSCHCITFCYSFTIAWNYNFCDFSNFSIHLWILQCLNCWMLSIANFNEATIIKVILLFNHHTSCEHVINLPKCDVTWFQPAQNSLNLFGWFVAKIRESLCNSKWPSLGIHFKPQQVLNIIFFDMSFYHLSNTENIF
jgi:hypothetical protein